MFDEEIPRGAFKRPPSTLHINALVRGSENSGPSVKCHGYDSERILPDAGGWRILALKVGHLENRNHAKEQICQETTRLALDRRSQGNVFDRRKNPRFWKTFGHILLKCYIFLCTER